MRLIDLRAYLQSVLSRKENARIATSQRIKLLEEILLKSKSHYSTDIGDQVLRTTASVNLTESVSTKKTSQLTYNNSLSKLDRFLSIKKEK
jgi:hypothetical protein